MYLCSIPSLSNTIFILCFLVDVAEGATYCTLFNNWLGIFQPRCMADEDCLPIIRENKMSQSTGTFPIAVAPAVMCEKLN